LWLNIIIEIVLASLVMFSGCCFWAFLRLPSDFDKGIGDAERVLKSMEVARRSGIRFKMSFDEEHLGALESESFETILTTSDSNAHRVWTIGKWVSFLVVVLLLFSSFFLQWSYFLINLLAFLLVYVFSSMAVLGVVSKNIAFDAKLIQHWWKLYSDECEKFCIQSNPKYATVFQVVSKSFVEPAI
jgi:hypothetical protein